ncbi:MAG: hypothetical protein P8I93_01970 [Crocinitomicaceae bacterium]|nr:hypothetical protein [Crocinitomicaceae bacterium]
MFTKNNIALLTPVFGNYFLMLLTYYYFSWSVLFLFFFFVLEVSFFDFFQQLKNKKRAKQMQKSVLKADISSLFIGVFLVSLLEFFILGFSVLFEQENVYLIKELESFLLYEEFGISQGYFLIPLLFLSSFLRTNQELKQGLVIQGNLFKEVRKKALFYLFSTRLYVLFFAFLISLLRFNFSFLIWMLIFSVLMYQRIFFWKKTENKYFE